MSSVQKKHVYISNGCYIIDNKKINNKNNISVLPKVDVPKVDVPNVVVPKKEEEPIILHIEEVVPKKEEEPIILHIEEVVPKKEEEPIILHIEEVVPKKAEEPVKEKEESLFNFDKINKINKIMDTINKKDDLKEVVEIINNVRNNIIDKINIEAAKMLDIYINNNKSIPKTIANILKNITDKL